MSLFILVILTAYVASVVFESIYHLGGFYLPLYAISHIIIC